jgi:hypothetical protein
VTMVETTRQESWRNEDIQKDGFVDWGFKIEEQGLVRAS